VPDGISLSTFLDQSAWNSERQRRGGKTVDKTKDKPTFQNTRGSKVDLDLCFLQSFYLNVSSTSEKARALAGKGGPLPFPLVFPWHAAAAERVPFHPFLMALDFPGDSFGTEYTSILPLSSSISSTGN